MSTLKQAQITFQPRRTTSAASRGKEKAPARTHSSDAEVDSSTVSKKRKLKTDDVEDDVQAPKKAKRVFDSRVGEENSQDQEGSAVEQGPEKLRLNDKRWSKVYADAREKMGNIQPIHGKEQNKIHHVLRVFDLSYEYGPCVGVTRLERWERADALGLNPPPEVKDILLTKESLEEDGYKQCVFHQFEV
ncbi:DNA polymerase delta, subunit 4-domain-containing protein [Cristinia sonorae]|uniref:DNA polymerase delta, subunit 4-domain-containing protein n=1 Tax=Cristinia sonorae TaxID=1940300 RepID=A0A8K0UJJ8_9AGAR|nr:DNA polymerase delta, subunit 4-domain-containing protein [Cristinia sonorae]